MQRDRTPCKKLPKRVSASVTGSNSGTGAGYEGPKLVGEVNEATAAINGVETKALLDTGSCISLMSEKFYTEHFKDIPIQPLIEIINVECADGSKLPYQGYIEIDLQILTGLPNSTSHPCLLLITPETQYSALTPILLGTNILSELMAECREAHGERYLQKAKLHTPWFLTFRCMTVRDKELSRNKDRVAVVKCAEIARVIIGPNDSVNLRGYTDKEIDHQPTTAMIHECEDSALPDFIDLTPTVLHYTYKKMGEVIVNITNLTTNTITIAPKAIICELQPVTIEETEQESAERRNDIEKVFSEIHIASDLDQEQDTKLRDVLAKHVEIFSKSDTDIGNCDLIKHRIDLIDPIPFKQRHRRIAPAMIEEVRKHLQQLLAAKIIRKSKSPWSSNVVLVRKKNGKLRMCVDYRMLNNKSVKDAYALPRIEEVFDVLHGAKYFSTIDMKAGYYQVELEDTHKERTAFTVGPLGFYEYEKMPFGLSNSPATYQRLMEECLGDYNMTICIIYLDDLIIFSKTYQQHIERLDLIMTRLQECRLKLSSEKCFFLQKRVNFLGHVVSEKGIETDPEKIEKIKNWPQPRNSDELRSYLAFTGYYRRFIKDYSKLTKPLSDLLPPTSQKKSKCKDQKKKEWRWTTNEQQIFEDLKEILTSPPVLAYPDFTKSFELHTDASTIGLGAVLYQMVDNKKRVIAYASRSLSKSEKNYPAHKLEFLALKWAVTDKFADYLKLNHFIALTDNNPLTYILTSAKVDATGQRWIAALGEYDFDIIYRPGIRNADADGMSRYPYERLEEDGDMVKIDDQTVKAICSSVTPSPYIEAIPVGNINIIDATETPGTPMAQIEMREIRRSQREDPVIGRWTRATMDRRLPNMRHQTDKLDVIMRKNFKYFSMKRGVLYREVKEGESSITQLVLPAIYRETALSGLHDDIGHPGRDRTWSLVRERFFWPGMTADIERHVKQCGRCLRRKSKTNMKAPLVNIVTTYPLELICMDYMTLEPSKGGTSNILVITDHFTKFAMAIPTRNQTAATTANAFYENFILNYGIPTKIHSDQGANFQSELLREVCRLTGIEQSRTSIYHPMGNGQTERFNRTLLAMLGTLEPEQKCDWKKYVTNLVYAYNATPHESTKVAPFELMFGRKPRLPIDSVFQTDVNNDLNQSTVTYIAELRKRMKTTQEIVKRTTDKARETQKLQYDKKAKAVKLIIGDKVLVKIVAFEGKHKIADRFEQETYEVIRQPIENIPVYEVRAPDGKVKKLHRNHLLPLGFVADEPEPEQMAKIPPVPRPRRTLEREVVRAPSTEKTAATKNSGTTEESRNEETSDEESSYDESDTLVIPMSIDGDAQNRSDRVDIEETVQERVARDDGEDEDSRHDASCDRRAVSVDDETEEVEGDLATEGARENNDTLVTAEDTEEHTDENRDEEDSVDRVIPDRDKEAEEVPQPVRKSGRARKLPDRFDAYVMNTVPSRPVDERLHALDALMHSGVFNSLNTEMTTKILNSVMK